MGFPIPRLEIKDQREWTDWISKSVNSNQWFQSILSETSQSFVSESALTSQWLSSLKAAVIQAHKFPFQLIAIIIQFACLPAFPGNPKFSSRILFVLFQRNPRAILKKKRKIHDPVVIQSWITHDSSCCIWFPTNNQKNERMNVEPRRAQVRSWDRDPARYWTFEQRKSVWCSPALCTRGPRGPWGQWGMMQSPWRVRKEGRGENWKRFRKNCN